VIRLSCELPYAVGVRKNLAHSITGCQRRQSKNRYTARTSIHRITDTAWNTEKGRRNLLPAAFKSCLPTVDNLH